MESVLTYKRKQIIFREGDVEACLYDLRWGTVGIYTHYGQPNETLLTELQPGAFFGEMGMLDHLPRTATAVALENNTQVQKITEDTFQTFIAQNPAKLLTIMQNTSHRLRQLTDDYMGACRTVAETAEVESGKKTADAELTRRVQKYADVYQSIRQGR